MGRGIRRTHPFVIAFGLVTILVSLGWFTSSGAADTPWLYQGMEYGELDVSTQPVADCTPNDGMKMVGVLGMSVPVPVTDTCYHDLGLWGYTDFTYRGPNRLTVSGVGLRVGLNTKAREVQGVLDRSSIRKIVDIPAVSGVATLSNEDIILNKGGGFSIQRGVIDIPYDLDLYKNLIGRLSITDQHRFEVSGGPDFELRYPNGERLPVGEVNVSENGRWMVARVIGVGVVRIDTKTFEVKRFTNDVITHAVSNAPREPAISNSGTRAVVMWGNNRASLYDISDNCGDEIYDYTTSDVVIANECNSRSIDDFIANVVNPGKESMQNLKFSDDENQIYFVARDKWRYITFNGQSSQYGRLQYLAIGDSYSSGEGDITDGNHYLSGTAGRGMCHLSDRSYPFLLRDHYRIDDYAMKSVACSGAKVVMDYLGSSEDYIGQHNELYGIDDDKTAVRRIDAIANHKPGIVKQLDFVRNYKPANLTLTGGGNDIGFSSIIEYCATTLFSCDYAKEGSDMNKLLHTAIQSQHGYTELLIKEIKRLSPNTNTVIVGYPSFIDNGWGTCAGFDRPFNGGLLDGSEKTMINNAVADVNDMLQLVANEMNVSYVDVENALVGGRICEPRSYVNGVVDTIFNGVSSSFHPNAAGHQLLAEKIIDSNVFNTSRVPSATDFDTESGFINTLQQIFVRASRAVANEMMYLQTPALRYLFSPNSPVSLVMHSDPIDLGTYTTGDDGDLDIAVPLDGVEPGLHVLVVKGTSFSGEPVRYYQYIMVEEPVSDGEGQTKKVTKSNSQPDPGQGSNDVSLYKGSSDPDQEDHRVSDTNENNDTESHTDNLMRDEGESDVSTEQDNLRSKPYLFAAIALIVIVFILGVIYAIHKKTKSN